LAGNGDDSDMLDFSAFAASCSLPDEENVSCSV